MKKVILGILASLTVLTAAAQAPVEKYLNETLENSDSSIPELKPLDERIDSFLRAWSIRGASLAVTRNDSLVYAKGYGWADKEKGERMRPGHTMRLASVSKLITASEETLSKGGIVSFYYAGYTLSGTSVSASNMFATNDRATAEAAKWTVDDESIFEVETVELGTDRLLVGLENGLEGVRAGEECYILFSGKYAYGKKVVGTIPAKSALVYHITVEVLPWAITR